MTLLSAQDAIANLHSAAENHSDRLFYFLWQAIVSMQGVSLTTSGRGKRPGVSFSYSVKRGVGQAGKHYNGISVDDYANELRITGNGRTGLQKSITRSSVDKAMETLLRCKEKGEAVWIIIK